MGSLDARGIIAAVEIAVYVPILGTSIFLVKRHGFKRSGGFVFFLVFSIVRIVGAALHIASELDDPTSTTLRIIYNVLEGAGLQPLLGATLGFLGTVAQNGLDASPIVSKGLRLLQLLSTVALALTVAGGSIAGSAKTQDKVDLGTNLRHIGVILFMVQFVLMFLVHVYYWINKDQIMKHRRQLLLGISCALPFIFLRVLYAVLSGYAPTALPGHPPPHNSLSKFSSQSGSWEIYLVMSVLAEFISVIIYTTVGIMTPLSQDYSSGKQQNEEEQSLYMERR